MWFVAPLVTRTTAEMSGLHTFSCCHCSSKGQWTDGEWSGCV